MKGAVEFLHTGRAVDTARNKLVLFRVYVMAVGVVRLSKFVVVGTKNFSAALPPLVIGS